MTESMTDEIRRFRKAFDAVLASAYGDLDAFERDGLRDEIAKELRRLALVEASCGEPHRVEARRAGYPGDTPVLSPERSLEWCRGYVALAKECPDGWRVRIVRERDGEVVE